MEEVQSELASLWKCSSGLYICIITSLLFCLTQPTLSPSALQELLTPSALQELLNQCMKELHPENVVISAAEPTISSGDN